MGSLMSSCFAMKNTRMFSVIDAHRECFPTYIAVLLGTSLGFLGCIGLNKAINHRVLATCNRNLHQVVTFKTAVGDSYGCVSRMVISGPSASLKP
jgi:hypothetical protein